MDRKRIMVAFAVLLGLLGFAVTSRLLASQSDRPIPAQTTPTPPAAPLAIPTSQAWEYRILNSYTIRGKLFNSPDQKKTLERLEQQINQAVDQGFEVQTLEPIAQDVIVLLRRPRK